MTTALILFLIILFCSLLLADFSWSNVLSTDRNEVVFAGRNHEYGAYRIRQEHHRVMVLAMVLGFGVIGAATVLPSMLGSTTYSIVPPINSKGVEVVLPPLDPPAGVVPPTPPPPAPPVPPSGGASANVAAVAVDSLPATRTDSSTLAFGPGAGLPADSAGTAAPIVPNGGGGTGGTGSAEGPRYKRIWELDEEPEFPGGEAGLKKFLDRTLVYPEISQLLEHHGTVWVEFVVDRDGSVVGIRVAKGVTKELDAEAVRAVKRMPKWKPGIIDDEPVPVLYQQKFSFELEPR